MSVILSNPLPDRFTDSLRRAGFWTAAISAMAVVGLLCLRRISGALVNPLSDSALAGYGAVLVAVALLIRYVGRTETSSEPLLRWLTSAFVILAATAISLPGSPASGLIALWVLVGIEEGLSLRDVLPSRSSTASVQLPASNEGDDSLDDQAITQNLVRRREADGSESVHGWIKATFAAGERTVASHVAFCPPLASIPHCSAEPSGGPPLRVKVAQVLPHGVRFEVKLDQTALDPQTATIEFSASTSETQESLLLG